MDELPEAVDAFPAVLEKKVASALQDLSDRLRADFANREALLTTGFEGERNGLNARIEALETLAENQEKSIQALTAQREKAYEKVQEIANKAVASAGERSPGWSTPERQGRVSREDRE